MAFDKEALIRRFKVWCFGVLDFVKGLKYSEENRIFSKQLIRSSSSSYMNYKAACRAKSMSDMVYKLKIVEEELDESLGWIEMISERNGISNFQSHIDEGNELISIMVTSIKTLKSKL